MGRMMAGLELFAHNQQAYDAALHLIEETGKAAVIHPTGTGKSFIAFKLAQEHLGKRILWLAPGEYIYKTQVENLGKALGENQKQAKLLLEQIIGNILFLTYTKLMMNEDSIGNLKPDYIVLDEFHRCGAPEWGSSVRKLLATYPEAGLLGLSATNVRYLDNQRNMAEELFDGNVASEMTLGEAIARKILPAPTYVLSMYSYQEEMGKLQSRVKNERNVALKKEDEKLLYELRRALENAEGLEQVFAKNMGDNAGKYLVFCASKEHMSEMVERAREWFRLVDEAPHVYAVYYDNPASSKAFQDFKADTSQHLRLLFCINMLNEGVHVEDIDGVILLRPTISPILYLQQIGRALNTGKGLRKKPVIFDVVNNFDSLYTVDTLREEMEDALFRFPCSKEERAHFQDCFHIVDELKDCRSLFAQLSANLSASWEVYFQAAKTYYQKQGHLNVPKAYVTEGGLNLGSWLTTQRRVYAGSVAGRLSPEQIERLSTIGMVWEGANEQKFRTGAEELEKYAAQYGDADVPADYVTESGYQLGKWVGNIRTAYKNGKLEKEKITRLEEINMIWDVREYRWNKAYEEAQEYFAEHGNLQVPAGYVTKSGLHLGRWVTNQVKAYNGTKDKAAMLSMEQVRKLEALGVLWKGKQKDSWDLRYALAKAYYEENGHLEIPRNYIVGGVNLGKWLESIRLKRKNPTSSNMALSQERIKQMDAIGMRWSDKRDRIMLEWRRKAQAEPQEV